MRSPAARRAALRRTRRQQAAWQRRAVSPDETPAERRDREQLEYLRDNPTQESA